MWLRLGVDWTFGDLPACAFGLARDWAGKAGFAGHAGLKDAQKVAYFGKAKVGKRNSSHGAKKLRSGLKTVSKRSRASRAGQRNKQASRA